MTVTRSILLTTAALAVLGLAACDNGPSAVTPAQAGPNRLAEADTRPDDGRAVERREAREDARDAPAPLVDGKPMWSASRRYSAEENARRAFARNGEAFGASSLDAFVEKAHDFVQHPPRGAQTLTRANGDVLIYDPKSNVFAVRSKAGAPRTMFKPDDGPAYWAEQKTRESRRATARSSREDDAA
jgi:pyocin large subunit-like protein